MELDILWLELLSATSDRAIILAPADADVIRPPNLRLAIDLQSDEDGAEVGEIDS